MRPPVVTVLPEEGGWGAFHWECSLCGASGLNSLAQDAQDALARHDEREHADGVES